MSALPPKANKFSSIERGQATRSSLELACDKFLDHLTRLVGLRTRFRDPFVNGIFEQAIVALAAGGSVGLREFFLHLGQHVIIERALLASAAAGSRRSGPPSSRLKLARTAGTVHRGQNR